MLTPPVERIGALDVGDFIPLEERKSLAAALNTLLASPTFASWRQGVTLDIREWLTPKEGRTPAIMVSVAHLDDDERTLVLGVLLEESGFCNIDAPHLGKHRRCKVPLTDVAARQRE